VVDQLEDLFAAGYTAELQRQYIAALVALIRCQQVFVIATLRSDFYAYFQQFSELSALARDGGRFDLQAPTREDLGNMIRLPAAAAGLRFERDSRSGRRLDEALVDAAAASSEPLPLLGHVLSQMYRKQLARKDGLLEWSDYRDLGELEGALNNHAETVFRELGDDEQEAFDFVMRHLVSFGSGEGGVRRTVLYRDLVSSPQFDHRQKAGAKGLVDSFVKEELFSAETGLKKEIAISISQEVLVRRWTRARLWLAEDQGFLRMRDRLDANVKLWLSRDGQCEDLLGPQFGIADAETLLRHFRAALSRTQIDYIQKMLAKKRRGRVRNTILLTVGAGLAVLATAAGVLRYNTNIRRRSVAELARFEQRIEQLVKGQGSGEASPVHQANKKPPTTQNADFSLKEGTALGTQLALETQLKKAEEKAQLAQQNADLVTAQRSAMEAELKKAEEKAQLAQQNADLVTAQRSAMEAELKKAEEKVQAAQQNADVTSAQRGAMEAELKKAADKVQEVQQSADLAVMQRNDMEAELKKTREQLSKADETGQTAQKSADVAANQTKSAPAPSITPSPESTSADPQDETNSKASDDKQVLKKFVLDYLQTISNDDVSTQESYFARRVTYYDQGVISLRKVQEAKESYDREWPTRDWKSQGEPEIHPSANPKIYEVLQPFTWAISDGLRSDQGSATLYLRIWKNSKGEFHIVHIERRL
jgi:hypothetical protein